MRSLDVEIQAPSKLQAKERKQLNSSELVCGKQLKAEHDAAADTVRLGVALSRKHPCK
jgi:hypothetical protein